MYFSTILTLALSASTTLAAPAPVFDSAEPNNTLISRGGGGRDLSLGSFADPFCTGKPIHNRGEWHSPGYGCQHWDPTTDNIGISWGSVRAIGITFYTDLDCYKPAAKTYWSPHARFDAVPFGSKSGADLCLSEKGYTWSGVDSIKAVRFWAEGGRNEVDYQEAWEGIEKETRWKGGPAPH